MQMKKQIVLVSILVVFVYLLGIYTPLLIEVQAMQAMETLTELPFDAFAQANIVAVTNEGQGVLNKANVEIREGTGRILISAMPFIEPTTQFSLEIAKEVAEQVTGVSLDNKDVIFFVSETDAALIGGPSAGVAFTVATIAAIEGKKVRDEVTVTGVIRRDGRIGPVGGLVGKLTAAAVNGNTLFLVPQGQKIYSYFDEELVTRHIGIFSFQTTQLVRKQVDLQVLGEELGIQVREVGTIDHALIFLLEE